MRCGGLTAKQRGRSAIDVIDVIDVIAAETEFRLQAAARSRTFGQ